MYHNLFDSHVHSDNSPDAVHSVTFLIEAAVEKGVQGVALTDHCDCECLEAYRYLARQRQAALDVAMARAAFRGRVILSTGVELGQPHLNEEGANRVLGLLQYDFVLVGVHALRGQDMEIYSVDFRKLTDGQVHQLMTQYFDEVLEVVNWGNFDSIAHLTLPLRYAKLRAGRDIDLRRYEEQIDAILKILAEQGKALEINTSGLRGALGETMPPFWVVKRFRELGGELITIGSDCHNAADLGSGISQVMQALGDMGYEYFTFYRERKPVQLKII